LSAALYLIEIYFEPSVTTKLFTAITLGLLHAHMRASHLMRAQNVNAFEPVLLRWRVLVLLLLRLVGS